MAKKDNSLTFIAIVILIFVLLWGYQNGKFVDIKNFFSTFNQNPLTPNPDNVPNEYLSYSVILTLNPTNICAGHPTTGTIDSNIPNGVCSIFMQPPTGIWTLYSNVNLNSNGDYSETQIVDTPGIANFRAVCCDASGNCRISNQVTLTVTLCDSDGDGNPDNTDPDDDNDGYSDEEEIEAGTNPWDPSSHPGTTSDPCPVYCMGLGSYSTGRFVTSPGYCVSPEISVLFPPKDGYCCCMPSQSSSYTCGQGNDAQCDGTCPSNYPYCLPVSTGDLYTYSCMCVDSDSGTGNVHPDWKPGGSMFNTQGEEPEPEPLCVDSDGVDVFTVGVTTYLGISHPDVCHAGTSSYAVDEYVCINDIAVKKEIWCPNEDCVNGKCMSGTTTVYNQCLIQGYINGGSCTSGDPPSNCVLKPSLDTTCGLLYPLNHAICCN